MPVISPVSDLRNYRQILEHVKVGSPVFLTVNGRGKYVIRAIEDEDEFENSKALLRLLEELRVGRDSGEKEGYIPSENIHEMLSTWRPEG